MPYVYVSPAHIPFLSLVILAPHGCEKNIISSWCIRGWSLGSLSREIIFLHFKRTINILLQVSHVISMASRNRELEESIESVTCAICMEVFSDGRILVCNHTYCLGCLVSYQHLNDSTTKECPKCRRSTVPRLSEIPSLPPNVFANKVAELIRSHTSDEPVPGEYRSPVILSQRRLPLEIHSHAGPVS